MQISLYLSKEHILKPFYEAQRLNQSMLNLRECSIEALLVQTIAVSYVATEPAERSHPLTETCFRLALDRVWQLHSQSDDYAIPLTLCFAQILLYFFARPFHALGMLQAVEPAVERFEKRSSGDE